MAKEENLFEGNRKHYVQQWTKSKKISVKAQS